MVPKDTQGVFWAAGSTATCTASGFFIQAFALCTALYSASLCVYYIMVFVQERPESDIHKIEPYLHLTPIMVGVGTALVGLPLDLYNSAVHVCWLMPLPANCGNGADQPPCERGANAWVFRWALLYAEVWTVFIFMAIGFYVIWHKVYMIEKATERVSFQQNESTEKKKSRAVGIQAIQYVLSFCCTWFFTTLARTFFATTGQDIFALHLLKVTFFPLQGFWNGMIYMRPHYAAWKRNKFKRSVTPEKGFQLWSVVYWLETHCCCFFCIKRARQRRVGDSSSNEVSSKSKNPSGRGVEALAARTTTSLPQLYDEKASQRHQGEPPFGGSDQTSSRQSEEEGSEKNMPPRGPETENRTAYARTRANRRNSWLDLSLGLSTTEPECCSSEQMSPPDEEEEPARKIIPLITRENPPNSWFELGLSSAEQEHSLLDERFPIAEEDKSSEQECLQGLGAAAKGDPNEARHISVKTFQINII